MSTTSIKITIYNFKYTSSTDDFESFFAIAPVATHVQHIAGDVVEVRSSRRMWDEIIFVFFM